MISSILAILEFPLAYQYKAILMVCLLSTLALTYKYFFGKKAENRLPFTASRFFLVFGYTTWIVKIRPVVFDVSLYSFLIVLLTMLSLYNVFKASFYYPGYLPQNRLNSNKNEVI